MLKTNSIDLHLVINKDCYNQVVHCHSLIGLVLRQLLHNSIKFTYNNVIKLTVSTYSDYKQMEHANEWTKSKADRKQ